MTTNETTKSTPTGSALEASILIATAELLLELNSQTIKVCFASVGSEVFTVVTNTDYAGDVFTTPWGSFPANYDFWQLRQITAELEIGAWLSATMTMTSAGKSELVFNYEDRPLDVATQGPVWDDEVTKEDFGSFPRSKEHIPAWVAAL